MLLEVQKFLENNTFQALIEKHGVYASFDKTGTKFSMNYDQIESRESDLLSQQCRGLILSTGKSFLSKAIEINGRLNYNHISPGPTQVIAAPMFRFFNNGQGSAAVINFSDPQLSILEKLDGTLCIVYFDKFKGDWCVATRSVPEADLIMDNGKYTFRTLFEKAVQDKLGRPFSSLIKFLRPELTYCFELTTPYNRIVVRYDECGITLLSMRDNETLKELNIDDSHLMNDVLRSIRVKKFKLGSIDEIVNFVSNQNPLEMEGVVVRDSKFNRIKVKNAAYVAFNRARDSLGSSQRNCLELILAEKDDDVIAAMPPEIANDLINLKKGVQLFISTYDQTYKEIMASLPPSPTKKDLALAVQARKDLWQSPFFSFFDNKSISMKDFIAKNRKDGSWGSSFLDKILEIAQKESGSLANDHGIAESEKDT